MNEIDSNHTKQILLRLLHNDTDVLESANFLIWNSSGLTALRENLNAFFLIVMALHIHIMQYGFACLEAGCVRAQSATNSMWKNCISAYAAAIGFWLFGYAIAFGESAGGFVGTTYWALIGVKDMNMWFFQFSFCATASTIMSGAIAERSRVSAYTIASWLMSSFYYPFLVHWAWSKDGWLFKGHDGVGFFDFAGSGVIHVTGGACSLAAILVVPPRRGRWVGNNREEFHGHSTTLASLGCMILATGFAAFNAGSQLHIDQEGDGYMIALAAMNTMIAGAGGMFSVAVTIYIRKREFPVMPLHCGLLAGNVAICAGCVVVTTWAALLTGIFAGLVYHAIGLLVEHAKLDDPVEAVAVHGGGGIAGLLAVAFFRKDYGIFYKWDSRAGKFLGWQICGLVVNATWSFFFTFILFVALKKLKMLKARSDKSDQSIDDVHGHEPAYPDTFKLKKAMFTLQISDQAKF